MVSLRTQPLDREVDETGASLFQLAGADGERASMWWLYSSLLPLEDNHSHTGQFSHICLQGPGKVRSFLCCQSTEQVTGGGGRRGKTK